MRHHHHPGDPEEDDVEAGDQHVGRQVAREVRLRLSGQPSVEKGTSAEENQVSSTSSSRVSGPVDAACAACAARVLLAARDVDVAARASYQAGIWWPHHSWREMHQSWMFSSQWL
jgi:hypothetical protein